MTETQAFLVAVDRLALWVGRYVLWGTLLLCLLGVGLSVRNWIRHHYRRLP